MESIPEVNNTQTNPNHTTVHLNSFLQYSKPPIGNEPR